jgi:hypothetical protein
LILLYGEVDYSYSSCCVDTQAKTPIIIEGASEVITTYHFVSKIVEGKTQNFYLLCQYNKVKNYVLINYINLFK